MKRRGLLMMGVFAVLQTGTDSGEVQAQLAPAHGPRQLEWPLWTMTAPKPGLEAALGAGESVVAMDVDPRGMLVAVAVRDPAGTGTLRLWDLRGKLFRPAAAVLDGRSVESLVFAAFDASLLVLSSGGGEWRIQRFTVDAAGKKLLDAGTLVKSRARLGTLIAALLQFDGAERVFYGREHAPGRWQVMTVRGDGNRAYEVTAPGGKPTRLTDPKVSAGNADESIIPPRVQKADSALPLSLGPRGTLLWRAGNGSVMAQKYEDNWKPAKKLAGADGAEEVFTANGYFRMRWRKDAPGVELVNDEHQRRERVAAEVTFLSRPVITANGRALIGEIAAAGGASMLRTFAVTAPLAAVRQLDTVALEPKDIERLARDGMALSPPRDPWEQIYQPYEALQYEDLGCGSKGDVLQPVFASIDGFFEVLNAGFEGVFVVAEQQLSRPALKDVLAQMARVGKEHHHARLVKIAEAATKVLAGNLSHPEGKLIKAERPAQSTLPIGAPGKDVNFADFHPRGPYAGSPHLQSYFRAFKLMNQIELSPAEHDALAQDQAFVAALRHWTDVQRPFLAGTRRKLLFDVGAKQSDMPRECIPARVSGEPPLLFPLAWSLDSEILEGSVMRAVGPGCGTVSGRLLPNGLDLLAGLGSAKARELSAQEIARYPGLKDAQQARADAAGRLSSATTFVDSFLHAVQLVSTAKLVPEAISADLWQRRLLQSALGGWVGLRHTLVLLNEEGGVECDGDFTRFEHMTVEPARGVVDPLPAAWRQVGALLGQLADHAGKTPAAKGLTKELRQTAAAATRFGAMADRQLTGQPLTSDEYGAIEGFAAAVEHPYIVFKSVLKKASEEGADIPVPDPMMKIVDIQRANSGIWHVAVGRPIEGVVLLGDRGVLLPASGAVYSYYEVVAPAPIDDKTWRGQVDSAPRPDWTKPLLPADKTRKSGKKPRR
jgi:hypothetical protein